MQQHPASESPLAAPGRIVEPRIIRQTNGWTSIDFSELWAFRHLVLVLAQRDVRVRYKQTFLGIAWVVLQPLLPALVFAAVFGRVLKLPSGGAPYVPFCFAGMLAWNLFAQSIQRAGNSLIGDSKLISKVYFPRVLIPLASIAAVVVDFAVGLCLMLVMVGVSGIAPTWHLALLPVFALLALSAAVGVSLLISALNVYYRDFTYALPLMLQVWMFASPVVYSEALIPERLRFLFLLNPVAGAIVGFRWSLLGEGRVPYLATIEEAITSLALLFIGALVFRRVERSFADVI